jgi:hypothetical protein
MEGRIDCFFWTCSVAEVPEAFVLVPPGACVTLSLHCYNEV